MNGHGGKRRGAGRKPVEPNRLERLAIGWRCEDLRKTHAGLVAIANAEARIPARYRRLAACILKQRSERAANLERLRREGADSRAIEALRDEAERYDTRTLRRVTKAISPSADGLVDYSTFRRATMNRQEVMQSVSDEWRGRVSPRRVKAYWTEYRKFIGASGRT